MNSKRHTSRFLNTKTLADAASSSVNFQEQETVAKVNTKIDFNTKLLALLHAFEVTDIDAITSAQRSMLNKGVILLKFATHGLPEAIQILRNNNCSVERVGENKLGLVKAMKETPFLYKHEDVQVLLAVSDVRIDTLNEADTLALTELSLPNNIADYSNKVKGSAAVMLRKVDMEALRGSGVAKKYLQMYGSLDVVSNYINEKIMETNKDGNKMRAKMSNLLKLARLVTEKQIAIQLKKLMVKRLKAMLKLALKNGKFLDMEKIMRDMAGKLAVADRNIEEAGRSVQKMLDFIASYPSSMVEMLV